MSRHNRNQPRDSAATRQSASTDVIDPNAEVNLDQFAGDDIGDDEGDEGAGAPVDPAAGGVLGAAPTTPPERLSPIAKPSPSKRLATDDVLRIAGEIATEAKQKKLDTAEALIAFHGFVVDRINGINK